MIIIVACRTAYSLTMPDWRRTLAASWDKRLAHRSSVNWGKRASRGTAEQPILQLPSTCPPRPLGPEPGTFPSTLAKSYWP